MQKSTSTVIALFAAAAGFFAPLPLSAQTTVTYTTGQTDATDRTTTTANPLTLTVGSGADGTQSGVISGDGSITKTGAGTLTLTKANTYSGGTFLNAGTLGLGATNALGSGTITINGGTLRAAGDARTLTNAVTINSDFTLGRLTFLSGAITLNNDITLTSANPDVSGASNSGLYGVISGAHHLTFANGANPTGTIILSANNTYSGGTTLSSGTLQIGNGGITGSIIGDIINNGTLTFYRAINTAYAGNISGTGSLIKYGGNTLTLSGNNTYSGGTTISGIINFSSASNLGTGTISLYIGGLQWAAGNTDDVSSRLIIGTSSILDTNGNNITFASTLSAATNGSGTVLKSGAGTLTLSGSSNITAFNIYQGTIAFGTGNYSGLLAIGDSLAASSGSAPTSATISGPGTTWTGSASQQLHVGYWNKGDSSLTVTAGAKVSNASTYVGFNSVGDSVLTITGTGSSLTNTGTLSVGSANKGLASLIISNGASVTSADTNIGSISAGGASIVSISGSGSLFTNTGSLLIGNNNTGLASLVVSDGAAVISNYTNIGYNSGADSSLTISGAGSRFTNTGTFDLASTVGFKGTVNMGAALDATATAAGIFDVARITAAGGIATVQFNTTGTALAPTYFTRDGMSTGVGITTIGNIALVNTAGTTVLTGTLSHSGTTTVNGGSLIVNGGLTLSAVTVNTGATLGGSGTFGRLAAISSGAHLAPGNSPGTITFTGGLALNDGAILDLQLGTISDLIRVSGGTLTGPDTGTITVNLIDSGGFSGGTYTLIDATGATLTSIGATQFELGTVIGGYTYTFSQVGNQILLTASAIPEPATFAALAGLATLTALALTLAARRGRRSK